MLLATHFIYSIMYSAYAVIMFKHLCVPKLNETVVLCNFSMDYNQTNIKPDNVNHDLESDIAFAKISWIFLVVFTIVYFLKELTKIWHQQKLYFR